MSQNSPVESIRLELSDILPYYLIISDALAGEKVVKSKSSDYLPIPGSCSTIADERYQSYLKRAVYYNVIQPTREALVGQLFLRPPIAELPTRLKILEENINGQGLTLALLVRKAADHVLPYGRGGLLVDFPIAKAGLTAADVESGNFNPVIQFYEPWSIINWQVENISNKKVLTLLVLQEVYESRDSGSFTVTVKKRFRVYELINGQCQVSIWTNDIIKQVNTVTGHDGQPLTEIPFEFLGSKNNDSEIDDPPFYGLASLNLAHYRNSADYEESVFLVGQPTLACTGLTDDWVTNHFPKGEVQLGSRAALPLPQGGDAKLIQANPNTLSYEAMTHKEEQMVAIGARLVSPKNKVERKQAEIELEAAGQKSVLMTIRDNLQQGLLNSLKRACVFVGENPESIKLQLNDNFDLTSMTAEELRWLLECWTGNAIPFSEMRENLRRSGIAKLTDEQAKTEIMAEQAMKKALAPDPVQTVGTKPRPSTTKKVKPKNGP